MHARGCVGWREMMLFEHLVATFYTLCPRSVPYIIERENIWIPPQ
jgi:hypothetical protein